MRSGKSAIAIVSALLITSCGAAAARPAAAGSPSASPTAAPAALVSPGVPLRTPPTNGGRTLVVDEQDNGHAVSLRAGQRLEVVLGSTYWQFDGSSQPNVLRPTAPPAVAAQPRGCVPGEGCGTVTADFDAVAPGRADVNAKRTSCGEAMSCTGNLGLYHITVIVTA
jgi:hypothetical protein